MNITESIAKEISLELVEFLRKTPEIQVYANINQYRWRDGRYTETADVWSNPSYNTRAEMRQVLKNYLESKGDF